MTSGRDHHYTLGLAETALRLIKAHELPGDPPSFEIWYTYAGRFIPALNQAINEAQAASGTLSAAEIDRIYDRHLGTFRRGEQIEKIAEAIGGEVDRVAETVDAAIRSAARYGDTLSNLCAETQDPSDWIAVRLATQTLLTATRTATLDNCSHKAKLEAAGAQIERLRSDLDSMRFESRTDALTALANRKQFDQSLSTAIATAAQTEAPLTLLMCDVDHFKAFNDTWGHTVGDDVLRLIARAITEAVRQSDIAARYGGEEFAVILPDTDIEDAALVAERLRVAVNSKEIVQRSTGKTLGRITISSGLAQWLAGESMRELIERADACLYMAKHRGRDQVVWRAPTAEAKFDAA